MFGDRPRCVRDYLNDASIKALKCANASRTGQSGSPAAAANARVMSAVLAEVRDALDLRAPWLQDYPQLLAVIGQAENASRKCAYQLDLTAEALAGLIADALNASQGAGEGGED